MTHSEPHRSHRAGWLRAAVLGANDGIVSTASLIVGVAAANAGHEEIMIAGIAGLVAGAMSMAAGEYVSVCSQADAQKADLDLERQSLENFPESEKQELVDIYIKRGLTTKTAEDVAEQLTKHDALAAHARDDIGITEIGIAKPFEAAFSSALTFSIGAALPLLAAWLSPIANLPIIVASLSLLFLFILGALAANAGGAKKRIGALRVTFWGALAMGLTALVGKLFGIAM